MLWQVRQTICGLKEIDDHAEGGFTHMLSILDPETPEPAVERFGARLNRLVLRFHDAIDPARGETLPARAHVEAILAFGRTMADGDPAHLLVHCHMGISRSVAAACALVAQAHPEADETAIMDHILSIRKIAWPNTVLLGFADELLGRDGRLVAAARHVHRHQLDRHPKLVKIMRDLGRDEEVDAALALPSSSS